MSYLAISIWHFPPPHSYFHEICQCSDHALSVREIRSEPLPLCIVPVSSNIAMCTDMEPEII